MKHHAIKMINTTLIAIQLCLGSVAFAASCPAYDNKLDNEMIQAQKECDQQNHKHWNCELNRCMTDQEEVEAQAATKEQFQKTSQECEQKETAQERRECYEKAAKEQAGGEYDQGEYQWQDGLAQSMEGIAVAIALANYVSTEKIIDSGMCTSLMIYNIAAIATIAAELYYFFMLKNKLDELKDAYVNNQDPFTAQLDAFNYLRDEQETLKEILQYKAIFATVLTTLYTAAAIAGFAEYATDPTASCVASSSADANKFIDRSFTPFAFTTQQTDPLHRLISFSEWRRYQQGANQSINIDKYSQLESAQIFNLDDIHQRALQLLFSFVTPIISLAHAGEEPTPTPTQLFEEENYFENGLYIAILTGAAAGSAILLSYIDGVDTFFQNPLFIGIISTLVATSEGILMGHYWNSYGETKENLAVLDDVITRFESSRQGYCSESDRQDQSNSKCYCYNDDGTRNTKERGNSQICQKLWTPPSDAFRAANDKNKSATGPTGCMTLDHQFDPACKCRQFKDPETGENACYKTNKSILHLDGLGQSLGLPQLANKVDQMSEGNYGTADLAQANGLHANLAAARRVLGKLHKSTDLQLKKQGEPSLAALAGKMNKTFSKLNSSMARSQFKGILPLDTVQAAQNNLNNRAAIQKVITSNDLGKILYSQKGKKKGARTKLYSLLDSPSALAPVSNATFMDYQYQIKHKDIVTKKDVSIWKIISNRYNQSGLRLLFK